MYCVSVIQIRGATQVYCGETAHLKADVNCETYEKFSVDWKIEDGDVTKRIDIHKGDEKYSGSTDRELFIHNVGPQDAGGYRAVIQENIDVQLLSNIVYIQILDGKFLVMIERLPC